MTKQEAINTLANFKRYISGGVVIDAKANEALDMAIEALSEETSTIQEKHQLSEKTPTDRPTKPTNIPTEPTTEARKREPSDDLISRAEAIEHFMRLSEDESLTPYTQMLMIGVSNEIKKLPSADRPRGKWHYSDGKPATIGRSFGVICDQCGAESEYCTNFCGECGADMRATEGAKTNDEMDSSK